jgi:proteasome lid subunit RPN8/RPN11
MSSEPVSLPRHLVNQLLHCAQLSPDAEVCGLVGGKDGVPTTCYPIPNVAAPPDCRFLLDPRQQIEVMRTLRDKGETLFAIFHSHPAAPAEPSATDLEQAAYPDALYLIVSLNTQGVLELRGFRIASDRTAAEVPLTLEPPA